MLTFFRQIRKGLLNSSQARKYILYALGEIALVVIGILIALQLNTNAENNKLNKKRQEYYNQLMEDLQSEIKDFKEFKNVVQKDEDAYKQYLSIYNKPNLQPIEIYNELVNLRMYSNTFTFNSSTIESLRSSGELILFPLEIRNKLMDLLQCHADCHQLKLFQKQRYLNRL